jgi:mono/diheme cytochrome c family protein
MKPFTTVVLAVAVLVSLAAARTVGRDQVGRSEPPLIIKSTYGADLYQFYCSSCHGSTGRGGTPRSSTHPAPPDLTVLSKANGGVFPRDRVRAIITFGPGQQAIGAHGSADMPVWGAIFRGLEPSDAMTTIRIENLVAFIESMQARARGEDQAR